MEKLSRLIIGLVLFVLFLASNTKAQINLCLIEVQGLPQIELTDKYQNAKKGDFLKGNHLLQVKENESVKCIDTEGNLYTISNPGSYGIQEILANKVASEKANVTKKYFSYMYKKMFTDFENNSKAGVVYRLNPAGTLVFPKNNRQIVKDTIRFEWTNEIFRPLTFSLVDMKTKQSMKIITNGNYITLPVDGNTLKIGSAYKWTILADGDLKPIYHNFTIIDKVKSKPISAKVKEFETELLKLGFDKSKIHFIISDSFNIQY